MGGTPAVVAGIDVGGQKKGFHAVLLEGNRYQGQLASCDPQEIVRWCINSGAKVVGVDAPCAWCPEAKDKDSKKGRPAERELKAGRIQSFYSPTQREAESHPTDFYGWMKNGQRLYTALKQHYALYAGTAGPGLICFETFPHAVVWALNGGRVPANGKATSRRAILSKYGVNIAPLKNIDLVDAALCAWTAHCMRIGDISAYGEPATGFIVTPRMA